MPAVAKTVVATALALALVGGGGATLAQPSNAVAQHTGYVSLVEWTFQSPEDPEVITGKLACDPTLPQRVWSAFSGQPACEYEGYAYAYPVGHEPPWNATIRWVNDSYYVDERGGTWHVAEVVYRTARQSPEGGEVLVKAIAGEILPSQKDQGGLDVNYALPLNEDHLDRDGGAMVVGFGPQPPATPA